MPKAAEQHERLISQQEAMRILDISPRQMSRLLRDRDDRGRPQIPIPSVMVGATRKFLASEIRAWLRRTNTKADGG